MTPHPKLLNPTLLHKGLVALWTHKDTLHIMDISFVFHREKPPDVIAINWPKPAIAFFQLQPDKNQKKESSLSTNRR
jgi:hypothetical protein